MMMLMMIPCVSRAAGEPRAAGGQRVAPLVLPPVAAAGGRGAGEYVLVNT